MEKNGRLLLGAVAGAAVIGGLALLGSRRSRYEFTNKVVVIMGGSRGLGLVLARRLADEDARIAICARDAEELERASAELEASGIDVHTAVCDVRDQQQVESMLAGVKSHFGTIDVLINNAGIIRVGPLELQTQEDFEEAMQVHFWGPYFAMKAVLPDMKRRRAGRIVNISSIGGKVAVPHLASYSASKFALVGLSSAMRTELVKDGVYVTTVCPGLMRTGSHINAEFKGQNEKEYALFSTLDALPLSSVSAEFAAKQILNAAKRGDAELVISLQAKLATRLNSLFPETTAGLLQLVDRFLPGPGDGGKKSHTGLESTSDLSPSFVTANIDQAAKQNNELKPGETIH